MLKKIKELCTILLLTVSFLATSQLFAAQGKSCVSSSSVKGNSRSTYLSKTTRKKIPNSTTNAKRSDKLQKRHSNQLQLLKEIHRQQIYFLNKYNDEASKATPEERQRLLAMINELPDFIKKSNSYFFDKLADIEIVVYDIINKKVEYKSKKKFKKPEDLLKDIQKKQRKYLMTYQKKEIKKHLKK